MLETLLKQRAALTSAYQTPLSLLRQLDRRLLLWCEHHPDCLRPATWSVKAGAGDHNRLALLWLETNARLRSAALSAMLVELAEILDAADVTALHWQLAACYSDVSLPAEPTVASRPETGLWSVMALGRRGLLPESPSPWREWLAGLESLHAGGSVASIRELIRHLWQAAKPAWPMWFYPLLLAAHEDHRPEMVNWLVGRVNGADVIRTMGVSGCAQFEPWLLDMAELGGPDAEVAAIELAGLQAHGDEPGDLRSRQRQWWANWAGLEGAPWSLFGGRW